MFVTMSETVADQCNELEKVPRSLNRSKPDWHRGILEVCDSPGNSHSTVHCSWEGPYMSKLI